MASMISELIDRLELDPWRQKEGFSEKVLAANQKLLNSRSEGEAADILNGWISENQPCLFGRHAAKVGTLSYCILRDEDLARDDRHIRDKIQDARRRWAHEAYLGMKSGFVILALSERLMLARPSVFMKELAQRMCSLYLLRPIETDTIYTDALELELPGKTRPAFRWDAGVNYFSAQGDGRWWQDHRIPGGIAFSVNSVGHMIKSAGVEKALRTLQQQFGVSEEEWSEATIDTLEKALIIAMRTINLASDGPSGRATELLPLPSDTSEMPACPIKLPEALSGKDYCEYFGRYHTDWTLPSEYFLDEVERPTGLASHVLDFTYLFDPQLENPDFVNMGEGRQIRLDSAGEVSNLTSSERLKKRRKAVGRATEENDG